MVKILVKQVCYRQKARDSVLAALSCPRESTNSACKRSDAVWGESSYPSPGCRFRSSLRGQCTLGRFPDDGARPVSVMVWVLDTHEVEQRPLRLIFSRPSFSNCGMRTIRVKTNNISGMKSLCVEMLWSNQPCKLTQESLPGHICIKNSL